ncbi:MAG: S9 family peptidase [Gemmataceae bacterium]
MAQPRFGIERFLHIRAAGQPTFSPDGRWIAYLTNTTGVTQVWQVSSNGGAPIQLTFTPDTVRGVWYNPMRHELVFSMDAGGNERTQLYHLRGVSGDAQHGLGEGWDYHDVTQQPKAIHQFGGWSHDGRRIAFSANRMRPDRFDIYVQELGKPAQLVAQGPGGYYVAAGFSPDDRFLLVSRPESNFNQDLYIVELAHGTIRHLTPHTGAVQYESPSWSADGQRIYCVTNHGGRDRSALAEIEVATGHVRYLETPEWEVELVTASPRGQWLAWLINVEGRSHMHVRHLKTGESRTPRGLPLGVVSQVSFSRDDRLLAFVFEGPRHNPDIWIWDLQEDRLRQVTQSSRAGIPFASFVEPELVHYRSFDGLTIPAWFYPARVPGDGRLPPVIVYPHGGPESQTRPHFSALFQYFLQAGYSVFAPNVRGSTGYGTRFMNLDNVEKRLDAVQDLYWGVQWLRDQKRADPRRIALYGGSYGGFMVLAAVTRYPDAFAAGISVVGIVNFVTFLENTGPYRRAHREAEYGSLREHRAFLEAISPIRHVERIRCPMMIIHGANDPRVPIGEAEQIVAALRQRGVPVEYLRYEDEGHGLVKLQNRLDAYPKMVAFLDRYLH